MKRGKIFNLFAGILDILFALFVFTLIVLFFVTNTAFVNGIMGPMFLSVLSLLANIGLEIPYGQLQLLRYIFAGILGLIGLLSLIFGSVTVSKIRKEPIKYYKGGSVITFAILETIALALFVASLVYFSSTSSIILVSVFGLIVLLRYIGIGFLYSGKKKYLSETPIA